MTHLSITPGNFVSIGIMVAVLYGAFSLLGQGWVKAHS